MTKKGRQLFEKKSAPLQLLCPPPCIILATCKSIAVVFRVKMYTWVVKVGFKRWRSSYLPCSQT